MKRKTLVAFVLKIIGVITSFANSWLISWMVGAVGMGEYQTAVTVAIVGSTLAGLGMNNAALRMISAQMAIQQTGMAMRVYKQALTYVFWAGVVGAGLVYLSTDYLLTLMGTGKEHLAPLLKWSCLAILPIALTNLLAEVLKGLGKFQLALLVQGFLQALVSIIGIGLMQQTGSLNSESIVIMYGIANGISCIVAFYWVSIYRPQSIPYGSGAETGLLASAMPLWGVAIASIIMENIDTILLGVWVDFKAVGIYTVAKKVAGMNSFFLGSVNTVSAPMFSHLYAQNRRKELQELAQKSTFRLFLIGLGSFLCVCLFGKLIISVWGSQFSSGWAILIILSVGQFVNVATGSVGYLLIMTGHEKQFKNNVMITSTITVLLYLLFIPVFGVLGAAIGQTLGVTLQNCRAYWLVYKRLGFKTLTFSAA